MTGSGATIAAAGNIEIGTAGKGDAFSASFGPFSVQAHAESFFSFEDPLQHERVLATSFRSIGAAQQHSGLAIRIASSAAMRRAKRDIGCGVVG